jgi:hypothetical protein
MNNSAETFEVIVLSIALFLSVTLSLAGIIVAIIQMFS